MKNTPPPVVPPSLLHWTERKKKYSKNFSYAANKYLFLLYEEKCTERRIKLKERRGSYQAYKRFHLASFQSASEASVHPHDPHNRVTADGTNDPTAFAKLDVQI